MKKKRFTGVIRMIVKGKEIIKSNLGKEKLPALITFKKEGDRVKIIIIPAEEGPNGVWLELVVPDMRIIIEEKLE